MGNREFTNGMVVLGTGLLASSLSSLLDRFAILGSASGFAAGFFNGLAVVAFVVAIYLLVRSLGASRK